MLLRVFINMTEFLSFREIARRADIVEATARFYRERFPEYFSTIGDGRHKKYSTGSIEILKTIQEAYGKGHDHDEVRNILMDLFGIPMEDGEAVTGQLVSKRSFREEIVNIISEAVDEHIKVTIKHALEVQANKYTEVIEQLKGDIKEMREYIEQADRQRETRDSEIMSRIREVQQAQQERAANKPWWKKIFGR